VYLPHKNLQHFQEPIQKKLFKFKENLLLKEEYKSIEVMEKKQNKTKILLN
jgi:hypothetical protein